MLFLIIACVLQLISDRIKFSCIGINKIRTSELGRDNIEWYLFGREKLFRPYW